MAHRRTERGFTFGFGQRVRVLPPHPEVGATGLVINAYLYRDGREQVFVSIPGGVCCYEAAELEAATLHAPTRPPNLKAPLTQSAAVRHGRPKPNRSNGRSRGP